MKVDDAIALRFYRQSAGTKDEGETFIIEFGGALHQYGIVGTSVDRYLALIIVLVGINIVLLLRLLCH